MKCKVHGCETVWVRHFVEFSTSQHSFVCLVSSFVYELILRRSIGYAQVVKQAIHLSVAECDLLPRNTLYLASCAGGSGFPQ